jgi:cellulose synthase/poly-beta-1,6-N-acetylglucosamine synthase-like glycosyltransferase
MVTYEFLSNIVATEYIVGRAGRIPSLNGAAFAIRKELFDRLGGFRAVVNEDTDLAGRAFFLGARFGFDPAMTVNNEVPERIGAWLKQRRRWAINTALWTTVHLERVLKNAPEIRPTMAVSSIFFPLPTIGLVAGIFLPLIPASMMGASGLGTLLLCLGGVILCFGPTALYFARKSKDYSSPFGIPSFLAFSAFYLPIWGLASMLGMINVATGNLPDLDWKHDRNQDLENLRIAAELKEGEKDKGRKRKAYSPR